MGDPKEPQPSGYEGDPEPASPEQRAANAKLLELAAGFPEVFRQDEDLANYWDELSMWALTGDPARDDEKQRALEQLRWLNAEVRRIAAERSNKDSG